MRIITLLATGKPGYVQRRACPMRSLQHWVHWCALRHIGGCCSHLADSTIEGHVCTLHFHIMSTRTLPLRPTNVMRMSCYSSTCKRIISH